MSGKILTEKDLSHMAQEMRCRLALKELGVREEQIFQLHGPVLFQVSHLMAFHKMDFRDACRWCWDNKGILLDHAKKVEEDRLAKNDTTNERT